MRRQVTPASFASSWNYSRRCLEFPVVTTVLHSSINIQVRKADLEKWLVKQTKESHRLPAPADSLGTLKLRGVDYLRQEFDKVVAARGIPKAGSEVGWHRNPDRGNRGTTLDAPVIEKPVAIAPATTAPVEVDLGLGAGVDAAASVLEGTDADSATNEH